MSTQMIIQQYRNTTQKQHLQSHLESSFGVHSPLLSTNLNNSQKLSSPLMQSQQNSKLLRQQKAEIDYQTKDQYLGSKQKKIQQINIRATSPIIKSYQFWIKTHQQKIHDFHQLLNENRSLRNKLKIDKQTIIHLSKLKLFKNNNEDFQQNLYDYKKKQYGLLLQKHQNKPETFQNIQITPTHRCLQNTESINLQQEVEVADQHDQVTQTNQNSKFNKEQQQLLKRFNESLNCKNLNADQLKDYKEMKKQLIQNGLVNLQENLNISQQMLVDSAHNSPLASLKESGFKNQAGSVQMQQLENTQVEESQSNIKKYTIRKQNQQQVNQQNANTQSDQIQMRYKSPIKNEFKSLSQQIREKQIKNELNGSKHQIVENSKTDSYYNTSNVLSHTYENKQTDLQCIQTELPQQIKEQYVYQNYVNKVGNQQNSCSQQQQNNDQVEQINLSQQFLHSQQYNKNTNTQDPHYYNDMQEVQSICISKNQLQVNNLLKQNPDQANQNQNQLNLLYTDSIIKQQQQIDDILDASNINEIRGKNKQQLDKYNAQYSNTEETLNLQKCTSINKSPPKKDLDQENFSKYIELSSIKYLQQNNNDKYHQKLKNTHQTQDQQKNNNFFREKRQKCDFKESINQRQDQNLTQSQQLDQLKCNLELSTMNKANDYKLQEQNFIKSLRSKNGSTGQNQNLSMFTDSQMDQSNVSLLMIKQQHHKQNNQSKIVYEQDNIPADLQNQYLFQESDNTNIQQSAQCNQQLDTNQKQLIQSIKSQSKKHEETVNLQKQTDYQQYESDSEEKIQPGINYHLKVKKYIQQQIDELEKANSKQFINDTHVRKDFLSQQQLLKSQKNFQIQQDQEFMQSRDKNKSMKNKQFNKQQHQISEQINDQQIMKRDKNQIKQKIQLEQNVVQLQKSQKLQKQQVVQTENHLNRQPQKMEKSNEYEKIVNKNNAIQQQSQSQNINNIQSANQLSLQQVLELKNQQLLSDMTQAVSVQNTNTNIGQSNYPIKQKRIIDEQQLFEQMNKSIKSSEIIVPLSDSHQIIKEKDGKKIFQIDKEVQRTVIKPVATFPKMIPKLEQPAELNNNQILEHLEAAIPINQYLFKIQQNNEEVEVISAEFADASMRSSQKNKNLLNKQQDAIMEMISTHKSVNMSQSNENDEIKQIQLELATSQKLNMKHKQQKVDNVILEEQNNDIQLEVEKDVNLQKRSQIANQNVDQSNSHLLKEQINNLRPKSKPTPNHQLTVQNNADLNTIDQTGDETETIVIPCVQDNKINQESGQSNLSVSTRTNNQELIAALRPKPRQQEQDESIIDQNSTNICQKENQQDFTIDQLRPAPKVAQ